ncbi:transient receptor potential cation channel subfamily A member 1 [Aplysia californica]|uniref:Transient receptor potential cation channel subfamily A member 1 n=1 Tax=Aplysia californica TaxID=6500 RepID=A0ABM1VVH9_APLCA|nr:transient receptor potential cation channel subfamily A member 1 [Aplysia californica]
MPSNSHEKRQLKKQDALMDMSHLNSNTCLSGDCSPNLNSRHRANDSSNERISIISNRTPPRKNSDGWDIGRKLNHKKSCYDHCSLPGEGAAMLDSHTPGKDSGGGGGGGGGGDSYRRPSRLLDKIRMFSKMRSLTRPSKTDSSQENHVLEIREDGPVCLIQESPNRIFRCAQNGSVKEVVRILKSDPTRLHARNNQGQMPLHVAAAKGKVNVVEALLEHEADVDAVDNQGNTALHLAVEAASPDICNLLIKHGADVDVVNSHHMMAIHLAADLGDVDVVKALLDNQVDPDSRGESGMTALHYAASKDHGEILRLMMQKGAKPCAKCDYGYYPIHLAAKCAAADAMEAIIEQALTKGYTREQILSFKDRENNLPLHAAVNGGDIKAVTVCLKAGASVKAQQDDGSTPLHFACAQGNMEMIKLMESMQRDNFIAAVFTTDAMKMTPLHRAALFNHTHVMQHLLEHGADIDSRDSVERTPLLLAASKGCWGTVQLLVSNGADVHVKDKNHRNFLHLAIKFGGKLEQIGGDFVKDIKNLQNERDDFGCTPVHYASREGHLLALDDLIRMGAVLNLKNNQKQSPFHFAARYGRYNTCRRLLDSVHGPNIINETDGSGLTALHIAAQNGHTKVIQLLLERGAVVNKDNEDNSALHHAAEQGWTHSMKVLLSVHSNLRDVANVDGDTPLHVAAKNGQTSAVSLLLTMGAKLLKNHEGIAFYDYVIQNKHREVAVAVVNHDRWEEVLTLHSNIYGCFVLGLIQHLPDVCLNVLNRCQTYSQDDPRSSQYHVTYNFKYLDTSTTCLQKSKEQKSGYLPMMALNTMVKNNRVDCLSHPVCVTFLKVKWNKYGMWIYTAYLLVYMLFLASLTSFVVNHNSLRHHDYGADNNTTIYLGGNTESGYNYSPIYMLALWFIAVYSALNVVKEVFQIFTQGTHYFADIGNGLEWCLYITSLVFSTPFLMGMAFHFQWEAGALAIFFAWFNCLVFLQRFDFFGIYVVMFLEILRTLVQVLCVFSILIIAFGLAFYMLMFKEVSKAYSTPGLALLRTFMMMLELDYMASFNEYFVDGDDRTLHFGNLTLVMLVIFVLLMPILLMNLLIGLAVGDIESVQRDARLKRLAMQVELHTGMEAKMPMFLHRKVTITEYKQYPNRCKKKLENFFSMISGANSDFGGKCGDMYSFQNSYMYEELYKQKVRMREMSGVLDKNNQLLRKIMQKMEIHTEDEAWDEGAGGSSDDSGDEMRGNRNRFKSKSFKEKMYLKSAVVSMWQKGHKK